jgi:hydrogenase maturation protease
MWWTRSAPAAIRGSIYRFGASYPLSPHFRHRGTHTFSPTDVIELARALHRLPGRLADYGIEGATFALGARLSPEAEVAVQGVSRRILRDLR